MTTLAILWVTALVSSLVFAGSTALLGTWLGAPVQALVLFVGPRVARFRLGAIPVEVGCVPVPMAFVAFEPVGDADAPERTRFSSLSRPRRIAVLAVPWVLVFAVAAVVLGPVVAVESLARGFLQIAHGAVAPTTVGAACIEHLTTLAATEHPVRVGARALTKLVAWNLVPLPSLAGFAIPFELLRSAERIAPPRAVAVVGTLLGLALALGWCVALVTFAMR